MANLSKSTKLMIVIGISLVFFLAEISVGFYTGSLALVADAFHYLNDLISFVVALVALKISQRDQAPPSLSFGWQRATLLGAFFNGVFLLALGVSIFLQAIERFVSVIEVENPRLIMIIGCVGLALNIVSVTILHEHEHDVQIAAVSHYEVLQLRGETHRTHRHSNPTGNSKKQQKGRDLGIAGVLLHVAGDAFNNIGVIIAGAVIWKLRSPGRFYADPAVGVAIAIMIFLSSIPLAQKSGVILLQSVPQSIDLDDVRHDIEKVDGVVGVHELHIWRLNQQKTLASAHVTISETSMSSFTGIANTISECLHAYGIHSATLQPEISSTAAMDERSDYACRIGCQSSECEQPSCCD